MNVQKPRNWTPSRINTSHSLTFALLLALGVVALIFVIYEIVERTWLGDVDLRVLHGLHIARGILSSIVAASLVGWVILRRTPPLLAATISEEEWIQGVAPERERDVNYARWFILMRWITVVVAVVLVFICVHIVDLLPVTVFWPLMLTLGVLAGSNLLFAAMLRQGILQTSLLQIQVYSDLLVLTVLLHFSGGIENPLSVVMLLHVIIGGIILPRWQCYIVAAVGSLLFGCLALAEATSVLEHYTLQIFPHFMHEGEMHHAAHVPLYVMVRVGMQAAILFLSAYFVTTVAERLRHDEVQLKKLAERALSESQLLEQSLETTGTALRVLDRDLQSRWHNARWQAWFGEAIPGSSFTEQLNGVRSAARKTFRDGRIRTSELAADNISGDSFHPASTNQQYFRLTTAPLRNPSGEVQQVVELAQDITDQKRAMSQLIRAGQLAAVGELAGIVAHEVNNPVAIICTKARLLLSENLEAMSPEVAGELAKIVDLSERVTSIAQGLLSCSRPSGAMRAPLDILPSIQNALALIEPRATDAGVEIIRNHLADLPPVRANHQEMEQVFLNLFLNALDAMPEGGRLIVSTRTDEPDDLEETGMVVIAVEDTGWGIPDTIHDQVFQPFFTTKKRGRGTGLGLSICQGIIVNHGGHLELVSREGEGTILTIKLPIEPEEEKTENQ